MNHAVVDNQREVLRSLGWAALLAVTVLAIYSETTWSMVSIWSRSETFAHGFLVVPISLWLIWIKRDHLAINGIEPAPWVGVLLLPPSLLWLIAWLIDVSVVQQLALVTMLIIALWAALGHKLARILAFPLFFLYFGVPMGEGLIAPMMDFTAVSTVWLIKLTGIPVYREGLYFSLPSGYWSVVEACSGVRYIIASVTVGTLYAYLTYRSLNRRLLFVLVSIIVPIFANTARAFIIVMLGHWSGMTIATGADHLVYGWVFFGIVIFVLFWLGNFFREDEEPPPAPEPAGNAVQSSRAVAQLPITVLFIVALAFIAPWYAYSTQSDLVLDQDTVVTLPAPQGNWRALNLSPWYWYAPTVGGSEYSQFYASDSGRVSVAIQFDNGAPWSDDVLGSSTMFTEWRSGSRLAGVAAHRVEMAQRSFTVDEAQIVGVDEGIRAWSWYDVGGVYTASAYRAKIQQALASLGLAEKGTYRIVIATNDSEDPAVSRAVLNEFLAVHGDALAQALRRAARTSQ